MAFFDEIGKRITQTSQNAAQKTKNMTETVRLRGIISDEEKRIISYFQEIGRMYCEIYSENPDENFAQLVNGVAASKAKIFELTEQIKILKGVTKCLKCGGEVPNNVAFCSSCGSSMTNTAVVSTPINAVTCSKCGLAVEPNVSFCTNCGNRLDQPFDSGLSESPAPVVAPEPIAPLVMPEPPVPEPVEQHDIEPADVIKCSSCGCDLPGNVAFCLNCGNVVSS